MPRTENGSYIGSRVFTTSSSAAGVFTSKSQYVANYSGNWPRSGNIFVVLGHASNPPYVAAYPFSTNGGFGTKISDPSTTPAGIGNGVNFSSDGRYVAVAHAITPFISTYPWSTSGFGSKFSDPATLPTSTGDSVDFTDAVDAIAVGHATSPFLTVYPWSSSGYGTKFSNPASLPPGECNGVDISGGYLTAASTTTPYIVVYPFSSSTGFGVKYSNPGTLPSGAGNGIRFSNQRNYIALAHSTDGISAYPWSDLGYGTKYTNPVQGPSGAGNGVDFSPSGDAVFLVNADNSGAKKYAIAYPWSSSGFGSYYTSVWIGSLLPNTGNSVKFHPDGNYVFAAHTGSPYISGFPWTSASGVGTKIANPNTLPGGTGNAVDVKIV